MCLKEPGVLFGHPQQVDGLNDRKPCMVVVGLRLQLLYANLRTVH